MIRCPNCGSTAQIKVQRTEYIEDGTTIEVTRYYTCGCGETSIGIGYYHSDGDELITHYSRHNLQQKLFGRG